MIRVLPFTVIVLCAVPSFADSDLIPISSQPVRLCYNLETNRFSPLSLDASSRGRAIWSAVELTGYFHATRSDQCVLDWGNVPAGVSISRLGFSYLTNSMASAGDNTIVLALYQNDNGWNSSSRSILACYVVQNLPGKTFSEPPPPEHYLLSLDLPDPLVINGDDLDGDGLVDFSYAFWPKHMASYNAQAGQFIAGTIDPNFLPPSCPGIENAYDRFADPNFAIDPNMNRNLSDGPYYFDSHWFGGEPFAQFYWEMYTAGCPAPGISARYCVADIGNFNCVVDLDDLAQLLAHFGESPAAYWMGDIYPDHPERPGDGIVDLSDLAEMLTQYGDVCTSGS